MSTLPQTRLDGYRADIDGLRAVAVLSVVVYHAFPSGLWGGYIGVDVFFVISGFLITGILLRHLEAGSFSLRGFYVRRIKRIFPSLAAVLTACLLFGWLALFPDELAQLGKHLAAGAGFAANLALWSEAGYFDAAAETKPLLHLWSLGIEEQFYILWPLLLWLLWPRKSARLPAILALTFASFAANLLFIGSHPSATFYLPFTRFWELLAGGALAYVLHTRGTRALGGPAASWVGALLYLVALFAVNRATAFPGAWAVLPTLGTCLVIGAGESAWINRVLLSRRLMVWFGLISYPLYLWHWPLLAFARILHPGELGPLLAASALALSVGLAWLTHVLVENPLRYSKRDRRTVTGLCATMAVLGAAGFAIHRSGGAPGRESMQSHDGSLPSTLKDLTPTMPTEGYLRCPASLANAEPALGLCLTSSAAEATYALVGDSHANHLFHGIAQADRAHAWLLIGHPSCPPVLGVNVVTDTPDCDRRAERALGHLAASPSIHTVVLAFFGSYIETTAFAANHVAGARGPQTTTLTSTEFPERGRAELFYRGLEKAVATLEQAGKQVVIVADVPELPFFPRACLDRPFALGKRPDCVLATSVATRRRSAHVAQLEQLRAQHPKLRVFDPFGLICRGETCDVERDGRFVYQDSHHLSAHGSEQVGTAFIQWLKQPP